MSQANVRVQSAKQPSVEQAYDAIIAATKFDLWMIAYLALRAVEVTLAGRFHGKPHVWLELLLLVSRALYIGLPGTVVFAFLMRRIRSEEIVAVLRGYLSWWTSLATGVLVGAIVYVLLIHAPLHDPPVRLHSVTNVVVDGFAMTLWMTEFIFWAQTRLQRMGGVAGIVVFAGILALYEYAIGCPPAAALVAAVSLVVMRSVTGSLLAVGACEGTIIGLGLLRRVLPLPIHL